MNKNFAGSFSTAFLNVMPQIGITDAKLQGEVECSNIIDSPGVIVIIGIVGDLKGNVIFAMKEDHAKKIASTMMGGMDVEELDELAQSAISELSNMLAANACIDLSQNGVSADISTPTMMCGVFTATASFEHVIQLTLLADECPFYIYVSLSQK